MGLNKAAAADAAELLWTYFNSVIHVSQDVTVIERSTPAKQACAVHLNSW